MLEVQKPGQPAPERIGKSGTAIVFLTVFIDLFGFGIVIPFLPLFAEQLRVGPSAIGVLLAVYSLMQLFCAPVLGRISDRLGRRPILLLGLLGSAVGYTVYGLSVSFLWMLFSRALHGAFAATVSTAQAYIADTTSESRRAHGMGMIGAAFGLGFVLGPAIGGLLGAWGLRVPVFFAAILCLLNFFFALLKLPESHPAGANPARATLLIELIRPWTELPGTLRQDGLLNLFGCAFVLTFAFAALESTFALLAALAFGYGVAQIGGMLAIAGLLQAFVQGWLVGKIAGRTGEVYLAMTGAALAAAGLIPMGLVRNGLLLLTALVVAAVGYGLSNPAVASLISKRSSRQEQGQVLGVNQSALSLARIIGPLLAGTLYQVGGPAVTYVAAGLISISAVPLLHRLKA